MSGSKAKKSWEGIGLMSGTSLDGIDLAYCRFWENHAIQETQPNPDTNNLDCPWAYEILEAATIAMPQKWYDRLYCLSTQSAEIFAKTDIYFGHFLGETVRDFINAHGIRPQFVASHGQTIFHQPEKNFTSQIGDGETMVTWLDVPLVTNFRNKDVALGGQGAPLVPFGEAMLFPADMYFLNLGGIANLTAGPLAFDVCACNMALNWLCSHLDPPQGFDAGGAVAASGKIIPELFAALEALPWYNQPPPKSLGKEWFEATIMPLLVACDAAIADKLRTSVEHIASRVAAAISRRDIVAAISRRDIAVAPDTGATPLSRLLVTGGGVHNTLLMERINHHLNQQSAVISQQSSVSSQHISTSSFSLITDPKLSDFKEAMIFAFLGLQTLLGKPNVLASVTGARMGAVTGSIHLPPHGGLSAPLIQPQTTT